MLEMHRRDGARRGPDLEPRRLDRRALGNGTRIAAALLLRESGAAEVEVETESRLVRAAPEPTAEWCARSSAS